MNITKLGHCCLLIETDGIRMLTDPGAWSDAQNHVKDLDMILITHEHADHFHLPSLHSVLNNNPQAKVYTNAAVGALLVKEKVTHTLLEDGQSLEHESVSLRGFGSTHAAIYPEVPSVQNTGFLIAEKLFYPGDAFFVPDAKVEVLALPVVGPWMKISDALDFAKAVKPKIAFPVHDGMLSITGPFHALPERILGTAGITFTPLLAGGQLSI